MPMKIVSTRLFLAAVTGNCVIKLTNRALAKIVDVGFHAFYTSGIQPSCSTTPYANYLQLCTPKVADSSYAHSIIYI
jgi:hypothetical protein